eukprot:tig00001164_g7393.t1
MDEVNLLGADGNMATLIDGYSAQSFTVNGLDVFEPVLLFHKFFVLWNVRRAEDLSAAALALVPLVKPKPEFLIIGAGKSGVPMPAELRQFSKDWRISIEIMSTAHACSTFNVLNQEGRRVAAALLLEDTATKGPVM